jgi:shikimate dehydrogenase
MHAAALASIARDDPRFASWRYFRFDVPPQRLEDALALMRARGFLGVNLTVPHKVLAMEFVRVLDAAAREAGAVNTLAGDGGGWRGHNTDGYGLAAGIRDDLGIGLGGTHVVLLGAGGAARGAAVECLRAGCASLWISNRTRSNLDALIAQLAPVAGSIPVMAIGHGGAAADVPSGSLLINATSAGLRSDDPAPADLRSLPGVEAVYDMIYNPPVTRLLAQARSMRIAHANGLGMLAHQGAKSLEIWTGVPAARTAPTMRAAAVKALG